MDRTYQPQVIELGDKIIESLTHSGFFIEQEITDSEPSYRVVYDFLTEKFINGQLNDGVVEMSEKEFTKLLGLINAECVLVSLKKKGLIDSYEDDNTEEMFFLSKEGKEYAKNLKKE